MARDILAIPVSTVASDSAFSTIGRLLNDHQYSTIPKTIEALICTQSWICDAENIREGSSMDELEEFKDEEESSLASTLMTRVIMASCKFNRDGDIIWQTNMIMWIS